MTEIPENPNPYDPPAAEGLPPDPLRRDRWIRRIAVLLLCTVVMPMFTVGAWLFKYEYSVIAFVIILPFAIYAVRHPHQQPPDNSLLGCLKTLAYLATTLGMTALWIWAVLRFGW